MLDEPTAGLSPKVMDDIFERILAIKGTGANLLANREVAERFLGG